VTKSLAAATATSAATPTALSAAPPLPVSALRAHLGAKLFKFGLLIRSQDFHDRGAALLAIRNGGPNLLNLLLLVGGQSELGEHLLHALAATTTTTMPPAVRTTAAVPTRVAGRVRGVGRSRASATGIG
jgi:hypothetical protein